jgi:spore coat polysaccharide biosynthesis protein SpsF
VVDVKTVAIIQARLGSQRLPGKALELIGDASVLAWVVYRTRKIRLDEIVVATTDLPEDDPIAEECRFLDVGCFRGSADDVLDRYYQAAKQHKSTHVLRVTADCPMLDPLLNQMILDKLIEWPALDYVASRGWAEGVGQEAFTFAALERAWNGATSQEDREHVVTHMLREESCYFVYDSRPRRKLSVDTIADLEFLRGLYETEPAMFDRVLSPG